MSELGLKALIGELVDEANKEIDNHIAKGGTIEEYIAQIKKPEVKVINQVNIDELLQQLIFDAEVFLQDEFGIGLDIPIIANGRLKRALGRFVWIRNSSNSSNGTAKQIELAKIVLAAGYDSAWDVLKHELVHYALFELRIPHKDTDREFIAACTARDIPLSGNNITVRRRVAIYECEGCGKFGRMKRRNKSMVYSHNKCDANMLFVRHDFADTIAESDIVD